MTCSSRFAEALTELGATSIIDYTKQKSILNSVLELVKESGKFDVIMDCCGGNDLIAQLPHVLKDRKEFGTYNTVTGVRKSNFQGSISTSSLATFML